MDSGRGEEEKEGDVEHVGIPLPFKMTRSAPEEAPRLLQDSMAPSTPTVNHVVRSTHLRHLTNC